MRSEIAVWALVSSVTLTGARAASLVRIQNLGFETWRDDGPPKGWVWGVSREAKATVARDAQVRHGGQASARFASQSGHAPHVYGGLKQRINGLLPRSRYRVRLWVRGRDVGASWFGGGPGWSTRFGIPKGTYDWRAVEGVFITGPDEFAWDFRINIDSVTSALWVDDVTVERLGPDVKSGATRWMATGDLIARSLWPVTTIARSPVIDGDPEDWPGVGPKLTFPTKTAKPTFADHRGPDDLSFSLRGCYDAKALYLLVAVRDDQHVQAQPAHLMWLSDSIQLAIDPGCDRTVLGYDENDLEIGVALAGRDVMTHVWHGGGKLSKHLRAGVKRTDGQTVYELAIGWPVLGIADPTVGTGIGFNILVNDDDGRGRRGYIQWTEGIGHRKDPSGFAVMALSTLDQRGRPIALVRPRRRELYDEDFLTGHVYLVLPKAPPVGEELLVKLHSAGGGEARTVLQCPIESRQGAAEIVFVFPPDRIPSGTSELVASLKQGQLLTRPMKITKSETMKQTRQRLDAVAGRLPAVKTLLEQARAKKIPVDYPQLKLAVVERFIGYGRDDLAHRRIKRSGRVAEHIERLLDEARRELTDALAGKRALPAVPRFRTSKVELDKWHFVADTEIPSTGQRKRRPVFFNGYGHFAQSRRDIPNFQAFGANIIQIERGPNRTVKPDFSTDMGVFDDYIMGALKEGAKHHIMVCLLTSPHYFPQWAYEKWPHLADASGGFIKFAIDPPEARRVHETHLKAVADRVKASPALHSICLSNEPIYVDSRKDKTTQRMWLAYLKRRHQTVERLNQRHGSAYRSFDDVTIPRPAVPVPSGDDASAAAKHGAGMALLYDWVRFNNERFSDWHRWMGDIVHGIAPQVWVHAKIMPTIWTRSSIVYGVDPEQFCRVSNLNGNDCWHMINRSRGSRYACTWLTESMFYDLLASMRTAPVINTEDHLIRDRDNLPVPAGHTYTVLWQGAIHRLGASTVWVWERTYDRKHDFAGSILHRPENVDAAGRAHLDLMRLSEHVVALQNAPRQVGLVFSITAIVHDKAYLPALQRTYEALSFTGLPVRFVSEGQLAAGQWDDVKVLIVPRVVHVPLSAAQGVARFAAAGRRVVFVGKDCLTRDEYDHVMRVPGVQGEGGRASGCVTLGAGLATKARNTLPGALRDALTPILASAGVQPLATLTDPAGKPVLGIEWQAVRHNGRVLVNLVNMTKQPIRFGLCVQGDRKRSARDLIGLRDVRLPAEAKMLEPMLLELGD